jgi:hypothetical protein
MKLTAHLLLPHRLRISGTLSLLFAICLRDLHMDSHTSIELTC